MPQISAKNKNNLAIKNSKLNKFSKQRVEDEINYIGEKAGKLKISNLHLADVNFGMYPQDKTTCEYLVESNKKFKTISILETIFAF